MNTESSIHVALKANFRTTTNEAITLRAEPEENETPLTAPKTASSNRRHLINHWFVSVADACEKLETWRRYYNEESPHGAIG